MAKPSNKHPDIREFLEVAFGRSTAINNAKCVFCGKEAKEFRNEISKKEYTISGLCQQCQDDTFGID